MFGSALRIAFLALLLLAAKQARAESVGVNFVGSPAFAPQPLGEQTVAGWLPQRFWVDCFGAFGTTALHADGGGTTAIGYSGLEISWSAPATHITDAGGLMGTFISGSGEPGTSVSVQLRGIPESYLGQGYALVVYYGGGSRLMGAKRVTKVVCSAALQGAATRVGVGYEAAPDSAWKVLPQASQSDLGPATPEGNVMIFPALRASTLDLEISGGYASDQLSEGVLNALQIVPMSTLPPLPPEVAPQLTVTGTVGSPLNYQIPVEGSATNFIAAGLPGGLILDAASGLLHGNPEMAGTNSINLTITGPGGAATTTLKLAISPAADQPENTIMALNVPTGGARITGLNEHSQIVGYYTDGSNRVRAFLVAGTQLTELIGLGGDTYAADINNLGEVAGGSRQTDGRLLPVLWRGGAAIALPFDGPGDGSATSINDLGQLTGYMDAVNSRPLLHMDGQWVPLAVPSPFTTGIPYAINAQGAVTGVVRVGSGDYPYHAVIWQPGTASNTLPLDIGYPGLFQGPGSSLDPANNTWAGAINDAGHVVGYAATVHNAYSAFLQTGAGMEDLGKPSGFQTSSASGLNNFDQVVGAVPVNSTASATHAAIWDREHGMRDLNSLLPPDSGWELIEASAINDRGQVAGLGIQAGVRRPFLLTPKRLRSLIVEQPQAVTLMADATLSLSVGFEGTGPVSYQWKLDGQDIPSATNKVLSFERARFTDTGLYTVVVTDDYGAISSRPAAVTVLSAPVITRQPESITPLLGTTGVIEVKATGTEPITYQWQRNGTNIAGATNATLTIPTVTSEDTGVYLVVLGNQIGVTTSDPASIRVILPPSMSLAMYAGVAIAGEPGQTCRLEYANALEGNNALDWRLLTRVTLTNRNQLYFDMDSPAQPKRFYRVVLEP